MSPYLIIFVNLCLNNEVKALLMKNYLFELFITTKKELQIQESPIFKSSKMLDLYIGTPERFDVWVFKGFLRMIDLEELKYFVKKLKLF